MQNDELRHTNPANEKAVDESRPTVEISPENSVFQSACGTQQLVCMSDRDKASKEQVLSHRHVIVERLTQVDAAVNVFAPHLKVQLGPSNQSSHRIVSVDGVGPHSELALFWVIHLRLALVKPLQKIPALPDGDAPLPIGDPI